MKNKEICEEKSVNEKNLEVFNRYFPSCLSIENDDKLTLDVERLKALLGDFSEIKEEGYGLNFVGKKIALNEAFKKNNKILKPLNESTSKHILIKGDNLDALKILKQSYSEKIKMIYIDPPYNTKNDNFIYRDDFSQSNEETLKQLDYSKENLDYIKNLFGSKCHSGWLRFMYPRLLLAKDLLKQDGVIFISIDDNECANLKLLCDEIFGEGNFVNNFIWLIGKGKKDKNSRTLEQYILCYSKDKTLLDNWIDYRAIKGKLNNPDNDKRGNWFSGSISFSEERSNKNSKKYFTIKSPSGIEWSRQWMVEDKEEMEQLIKENKIYFGEAPLFNKTPRLKIFENELLEVIPDNIFNDLGTSRSAIMEVKNMFGCIIFDTPKPVELIKHMLKIATKNNDIILDFFAGSGTTAHAVLESNKSDYQKLSEGGGGSFNGLSAEFKERRFILVQLDEKIDPKKNKSAHDFCLNTLKSASPSIFDITEERIKRAGAKIKEDCPSLDVGFQAFEIIDDETHANDKNLGEAHQKDLLAFSNPKKRETKTILINLLCCENLELTTPITCLIENALYLAKNTAFIVGDVKMSEVLENLKDKGVEKISMYMPAISNDNFCLELGSNLFDLKLESGDLKIRG
ncbi:site-specific DNA-methyltransferase [Helicobacter pylori]|uniref:site-specific DNA-methyltransferase (adenine-specific) n=1 Tax=Helicobacter pylori TaxID=210 RepID=A0A1A9HA55_HELPX|nr:site-specific DNA-methyltransferase [Helicobacter pylori]ANH47478.1 restriction endonuclease [Helicobacter pylori]